MPYRVTAGPLPAELVVRVPLLDQVFGMIFGRLHWRRSLEHAMFAHGQTHRVGPFSATLPSV